MENKFEIEGKVFKFGELKSFDSGYKKQDLLVELERTWEEKVYTDIVRFVVDRKNVDDLYQLNVGSEVKICFSLSGRMWDSPEKGEINFTDLKVIWFKKIGAQPNVDPGATSGASVKTVEADVLGDEDMDPLPF